MHVHAEIHRDMHTHIEREICTHTDTLRHIVLVHTCTEWGR